VLRSSQSRAVIDPVLFELPSDTSYRPDAEISWVETRELFSNSDVWIPTDLAINPAQEGVLREVDTNGLASGNTHLEAVVHGLCEVIERDALSQLEFTTLFAAPHEVYPTVRSVDLRTLPEQARVLGDMISSQGLSLVVQNLATDLGVPTFRSVLIDPAYPTPEGTIAGYFPGFGTHPNKQVALMRSLSEALQSRVGFIHGGRDSFNTMPNTTRRAARQARQHTLFRSPTIAYDELPSLSTLDLREELGFLLQRISRIGIERVLVTELTRKEWGIPVVRVRVPGLACFLVNRRRVGERCLRHLV
jgi:ribosomal protein S12 methylthiotransferase accessory factor